MCRYGNYVIFAVPWELDNSRSGAKKFVSF